MNRIRLCDYINQSENINIFKYISKENEPEHIHEFIEIVYIKSGNGRHFLNGVCYPVEKGDLLFINFNQTHAIDSLDSMEIVNCLINPEFIDAELINSENAFEILALTAFQEFDAQFDRLIPLVHFQGKHILEIEALIHNMIEEFTEKPTNYRTALKGYLLILLTKIFREMQKTGIGSVLKQVSRITPDIIKYIEENCFEKISLTGLAHKCFYNPSYFSKVFKDFYGKSLTEYIHEKRVHEAMRLLTKTNLSIESISRSVGYNDRKQFYKIFKDHLGITPGQVRLTTPK
jgi:AraC-like DNA-binding protein